MCMNTIPKKILIDKPPRHELSAEQRQAVEAPGPLLIRAGAGSGKTRVLIERVAHLIAIGVDPFSILVVTFSVRAAHELRDRLDDLLHPDQTKLITISTLHALGLRMLRDHGDLVGYIRGEGDKARRIPEVCSQECAHAMLNTLLQSFPPESPMHARLSPDDIAHIISTEKCNGIPPAAFASRSAGALHEALAWAYAEYQSRLKQAGLADFDDLIAQPLTLLTQSPEARHYYESRWIHILADEIQDVNEAQYALLCALAAQQRNLTLAGDDLQSIYAFRGALGREVFDRFKRDFPEAHEAHLPHNFRSNANIVRIGDALLGTLRPGQETMRPNGCPVFLLPANSEHQEAERIVHEITDAVSTGFVRHDECAVLCRTWAQVDLAEKMLLKHKVPCSVVGRGHFFEQPEIKFLLACLHLSQDVMGDSISLLAFLDGPPCLPKPLRKTLMGDAPELLAEHLFDEAHISNLTERDCEVVIAIQHTLNILGEAKICAPADLLGFVLQEGGLNYSQYLRALPNGATRLERANELRRLAQSFGSIADFLDEMDALSGQDPLALLGCDRVRLLTLHAAKGLEFRLVFFIGVEEGLIPHHSATSARSLKEELRLVYVGLTRATEVLCLSFARMRDGKARLASPWLRGLPLEMRQRPNWAHIAQANPIAIGGAA
jgi:superfamily I DNA/RNA helicase